MSAARKLACVVVAVLAWTSLAAADATPVTPARGAVVATSTPLFAWTVPAGEATSDVYISSSPKTHPSGAFKGKIVDSQTFSNAELRWTPTRPLFAGAYWWTVKTTNAEARELYSAPRGFTVRASGRITTFRHTRYVGSRLFVSVKWRTNTRTSKVTLRVKRGGKVLWTYPLPQTSLAPESELIGLTTWFPPRGVATGTRLTLTATLKAGSFTKTLKRPFRSP